MQIDELNLPDGLVDRILYAAGPRRDAVLQAFAEFKVIVPEAMPAPVDDEPVIEETGEDVFTEGESTEVTEEPVAETPAE